MADYILKKEKEKRVERMDLKKKAEQTKRETAELKTSRENAERALAELKDKLEKLQNDYIKKGIGAYLERKKWRLEKLQNEYIKKIIRAYLEREYPGLDRHAQNGARQEQLVESLNQALDDKDGELAESDDTLA